MNQLAVIGNPIVHSLSPVVFADFALQSGIKLNYQRILANDGLDFQRQVADFFAKGGLAINVTSPFKQAAFDFARQSTMRSRLCLASNFLYKIADAEIICADTTDGIGLVRDIENNLSYKIAGKKILLIGSGFVLDSILYDLITAGAEQIGILARNQDRVLYLKQKFRLDDYQEDADYHIIINTLPHTVPMSVFSDIKKIADYALCYDLTYAKTMTDFMLYTKQLNTKATRQNGLGMLVETAKVAFIKLFGCIPDTQLTLKNLLEATKESKTNPNSITNKEST